MFRFYQPIKIVVANSDILKLHPSCLTHCEETFIYLKSKIASAEEIRGNAGCCTSAKRVKNPCRRLCTGLNQSSQNAQRFLSGMLAARLLPSANSRQMPDIRHLLAPVQFLHQFIIKVMCYLWRFASPDYKLRTVCEVSARNVWWRISLRPSYDIQYFKAELYQLLLNTEYIMVCSRYPDSCIFLHVVATSCKPTQIESIHFLRCNRFVPFALVHTDYPTILITYTTTREEIRRVRKHHVKAKLELRQGLHAITLNEGEIVGRGFVVWLMIVYNNLSPCIIICRQYNITITIQSLYCRLCFRDRIGFHLQTPCKHFLYRNVVPHKLAQNYDQKIR